MLYCADLMRLNTLLYLLRKYKNTVIIDHLSLMQRTENPACLYQ